MDFIKILDLSNNITIFSIKDASTKIEPGIKVLYDNKFFHELITKPIQINIQAMWNPLLHIVVSLLDAREYLLRL